MGLKKKMKAFFTLKRRANDGFTLVELIVVIAILAILAGVGSVGYAGYIKAANKGNDKVLVGNVMRAIETGTNSYAFINDDSFKMGKIAYPVGFVALSADPSKGTTVVTSKTNKVEGASACEFATATVTKITTANVKKTCGISSETKSVATITNETIQYCTVHGAAPAATTSSVEYITAFNGCTNSGLFHSHNWNANVTKTTVPAGTLVADSSVQYVSDKDSSKCAYAYANQYDTFDTSTVGAATMGDPLYDSLVAAFGSDFSAMTLSYDGWVSDEGVDYATIYNSAPQLMQDIERLADLLVTACDVSDSFIGGIVGGVTGKDPVEMLGLSKSYANSEEILTDVSANVAATFDTEEAWMAQWDNDDGMTWDSYGFGINGRENYSAMRMAYNNAFASYLETKGETKHLNTVREFYSQELLGVGLPGLICSDAFTDPDSPLKEKITNEEELNALHDLYKEYLDSNAFLENGRSFYDILVTFDDTSDVAYAYADMNGGDIYDYYNNYVNEANALYKEAQAAAGDGIVIIVVVEDGLLNFQVSPSAANPRND